MVNKGIQIGQIWLSEKSGDKWLVTKVYSEAFTSYAVLRKIDDRDPETRRVRVEQSPAGPVLSGFKLMIDEA